MKPKTQTPSFPMITNSKSKKMSLLSYPTPSFPSCFRPRALTRSIEYPSLPPPPPPPPPQSNASSYAKPPNLTTSLYQTTLGIFSLTWSKSLLSRSLHIHIHPTHSSSPSLTSPVFHLSFKPFLFWNSQGLRKLQLCPSNTIWVFWDLTNAKFGSGPEPESGFYIAVLSHGEMSLLVGDMFKEAYAKTKVKNIGKSGCLVLRREHVVGKNKMYVTKIDLCGRSSDVSIELNENFEDDPRLVIKIDGNRVLSVKHLKWKFRGSERVEVDGHMIMVSWDVYNWLFESDEVVNNNNNQDDGYALFTFRLEKQGNEEGVVNKRVKGVALLYSEDSCGLNFERKKMKKRLLMKSRSPSFSSSSLSSVSSTCSSVLEWESVEENELKGPTGFSLLVYAWKY